MFFLSFFIFFVVIHPHPSSHPHHPTHYTQYLHRLDVRITRGAEGKTGRAFVGDMSEERAIQLASKVASEFFVYGVRLFI